MSVTVIKRTISSVIETAAQISNGTFGRTAPIGTAWVTARIALRYHMTNTGSGTLPGGTQFCFGLGSGTSNMVGDATCTNWLGVVMDGGWAAGSGQISLQTGPPQYWYMGGGTWSPWIGKKVGSSFTRVSYSQAAYTTIGAGASSALADRSIVMLDITKGSPNFTVSHFGTTANACPADQSAATLMSLMINPSPALSGYSMGGAVGVPFSEAAGVLDTIQLAWNIADPRIEICDLVVSLLA